ncbi:MAG: hypothetical protein WC197_03310 [Candidatus Gastranaerophilaceae bacterium]|jgi:hypothetical protein
MISQYLIIAENITYKNNKLSCINIFDQFTAIKLPAEFVFDLVVICGPGWEKGEHKVTIKVATDESDPVNIGDIMVQIPHEKFIYNALAQNLKITLGEGVKNITFIVSKDDNALMERTYNINTLLIPQPQGNALSQNPEKQEV